MTYGARSSAQIHSTFGSFGASAQATNGDSRTARVARIPGVRIAFSFAGASAPCYAALSDATIIAATVMERCNYHHCPLTVAALKDDFPPTETHTMRTRLAAALALLLATLATANAADDYKLGPDSQQQPGVPEGKV